MSKDNIKRRTIMKNGWLIQKENSPDSTKLKAMTQKIHKDKNGNVVGHTSVYKEISFSSKTDNPRKKSDTDNEYLVTEEKENDN